MEFDRDSRGALAAKALGDAINSFGPEEYHQFAEALCRHEHRTLQQKVFRAFVAAVRKWDEDYVRNSYDARNEATVTRCAALVAAEKRGDLPQLNALPYI